MYRRECLDRVIQKCMNDPIRHLIVPGRFRGVLPDGTTLGDLILDVIENAELDHSLREIYQRLESDNPNAEFHVAMESCLGLGKPTSPGRPRWYDHRLPLNKPLIDRKDLRAGLYRVLEADPHV
ncbi:MAG: hypothetical protein EOM21_16535 [Gammaproteobacteria bacterium]|nr:hypothetical protein [Gammaproteobacteria bacterium]